MSDLISRADAIEAVCRTRCGDKAKGCPAHSCFVIEEFDALLSADIERIEYGDRVELSVLNRKKDKVILKDAFGSMEYVPSADAISREDYEDIIKDYRKQYENMNNEIADLEAKLSTDAVHGEWQKVDEQPYFRKHYHKVCCSVCHKQGSEKYNFCPNCGARMENTK